MAFQDDFIRTALRVPPNLHKSIHLAAKENTRTFNAEIVDRLQASFVTARAERITELELALLREQLEKSHMRSLAAMYASALRLVADRLPANAFDDAPNIASVLEKLNADRQTQFVATIEQMIADKLQTIANIDQLTDKSKS